jgi:O-acetyl-ADP-ribose deacetylase (regulator of RNase III)
LQSQPDLLVGVAYLTGAGRLREQGVSWIVHGITTPQPGIPSRRSAVESALASGLQRLDAVRAHTLTLPEIGTRIPNIELVTAADLCAGIVATHLRRGSTLDEIAIVGRHLAYLRHCRDRFMEMGASTE